MGFACFNNNSKKIMHAETIWKAQMVLPRESGESFTELNRFNLSQISK